MTDRSTVLRFIGLCAVLYVPIATAVLAGLPLSVHPIALLLAGLHLCILLGLSIDLAELILAHVLPPREHPRVPRVESTTLRRVAILYACCDDIDVTSLRSLSVLSHVDVFVLDDSRREENRKLIDESPFTVVRRSDRTDFKAGNLNHWLQMWGRHYDYFVVLDADSIMTSEAVCELLRYAEHRSNQDVAVVQSSIRHRPGNRFQESVSVSSRLRDRVFCRLHDRIGWSVSHGHNNLHRTSAILDIGGFPVDATCEDTLVSLKLATRGWRVIHVDVETYDAVPSNILLYRRRQIRWARQTMDALLASRVSVRVAHGLLLARHLLCYVLPALFLLALGLAAAQAYSGGAVLAPRDAPLILLEQLPWLTMAHALTLACYLGLVGLRIRLAQATGASLRSILVELVVMLAITGFSALHVVQGLVQSALGRRVGFTPTGSWEPVSPELSRICSWMLGPWLVYVCMALGLSQVENWPDSALPIFLTTSLALSPIILWRFHRDQLEAE